PGAWRSYEITTRVEVLKPAGTTRVWVPVPSVEGEYQKVAGNNWSGNGAARLTSDGKYGAAMVVAEWGAGEKAPVLEVVSTFSTRNRAVDFARPDPALRLDAATARFNTAATDLMPIDGIVRDTSREIVQGKRTDIERARAIYDWIVDNTFRDPKTRGCGLGDIRFMLESGNLGGKCADSSALFVGLCRASGIPARDVYGLRVAPSRLDAKSLGLSSTNATRAQHCRAEVYLTGFGWVPVDPADVRKVVLEEPPGNLPLT